MDSSAVPTTIWYGLPMALIIFVIGTLILLFLKGVEVNLWVFSVKIPPSDSA
jgi:hypothetical protein